MPYGDGMRDKRNTTEAVAALLDYAERKFGADNVDVEFRYLLGGVVHSAKAEGKEELKKTIMSSFEVKNRE
ncbi:hypothetical protein [Streptomyces sp. NPDC093260]|uniref:hypothetical protein n=1 Tax=Streptomyces sp. NPDC093260 TaxID=3155073 RepID=UPI0034359F2C